MTLQAGEGYFALMKRWLKLFVLKRPIEWDLKSPAFWTCWRQGFTLSAELSLGGSPKEVPKTVMHKEEQQSQIKFGQISGERWVTKRVFLKDEFSHHFRWLKRNSHWRAWRKEIWGQRKMQNTSDHVVTGMPWSSSTCFRERSGVWGKVSTAH